jgi:hypothetical protein
MKLSRREMLQAAAAAAVPALVRGATSSPAPPTPPAHFFTPAELALVDELSDMIIPTDDRAPGARAAGVAAYIDARLAESLERERQTAWRTGLAAVEALSREMNSKTFLVSTAEQRLAVLTRMAAGEANPTAPAEKFFVELKAQTVFAYYTSKIGIHDDQQYKGNVYQTGDYAGFDAT